MTIRKSIGLAVGLVVAALAVATPASAGWWGNDGRYHYDNRWNNYNDRYYGYYYRAPPVVYSTPYNSATIRRRCTTARLLHRASRSPSGHQRLNPEGRRAEIPPFSWRQRLLVEHRPLRNRDSRAPGRSV